MSLINHLNYEVSNPYDELDLQFFDLDIPPSSSGFSDFIDAPNSLDTHMIQNNESGISFRLTPDDDRKKDNLPPIERDKMRKEEKNEEKSEKQRISRVEKIRKRQYRSTERVLFNKLRDLFPSDTMKTKHQLLREAIRTIQELRELKSGQKL